MKKKFKKVWIWVILAAAFVIIGPIVINEAYKTGKGYITLWGAEDVLSYYGMILAALGAAVGVFFSIKYSHNQYVEDKRHRVMPYYAINILGRKCIDPFDLGWYSDDAEASDTSLKVKEALTYKEYTYSKGFFIFSPEQIKYTTKLSEDQENAVHIGLNVEDHGEFGEIWRNDVIYIPLELQNVGQGCAINTEICVKSLSGGKRASSIPVSVPIGEKLYVGLYINVSDEVSGDYCFYVSLKDIYGNSYTHKKQLTIKISRNRSSVNLQHSTDHFFSQEDTNHADT